MRADLHIHTYYSDGLLSPEEVAKIAATNGVDVIAVTDHDTMLGVPRAVEACKKAGVKLIRGLEVSAYCKDVKLHTLGFNVNAECEDYKKFAKELCDGSICRAEDITEKLVKNGVCITMDDVFAQRYDKNAPVHTMHIARAGAGKGYANNAFSFFSKYLSYGKIGYSSVGRPSPERAIEAINASGGFASLAHPGRIDMEKAELADLVKRLCGCGLRGIEAVYSTHTDTETAYYKEMANALGLVVTGGSDTHYTGGNREIGSPVFNPDCALVGLLAIEE